MPFLHRLALGILLASSLSSATSCQNSTNNDLYFVTLEEHWVSPALQNYTGSDPTLLLLAQGTFGPSLFPNLLDVRNQRLQSMTNNSIRIQVVSHSPSKTALNQTAAITQANNQLAAQIAPFPDRFRGFCFMPMAIPEAAAAELERCVNSLGFVGALVDQHLDNGTYYDGRAYWPFWAAAERLGVPIYLHPTFPTTQSVFAVGSGVFAPAAGPSFSLATAADIAGVAWGWHQDVGLHFLRLYAGGVFDAFPKLKIVLGHMGEMVPFMLERADYFLPARLANDTRQVSLIDTWNRNVWITTAGFFSTNTMATILRNTDISRIMYSVDYPFAKNEQGTQFMKDLRTSGLVTTREWEKIAYGNAEVLLGL